METLVVGAGAMGRWTGRVVADALDAELSFLDRDPATARDAAAAVGGRAVESPANTDSGRFALVCIAVPVPAAATAIERYGPHAHEAVVDVTGAMADPVAAMTELTDRERASLHPLFAPDSEPGNVPVVVEQRGPTVEGLLTALEERGNRVFETTPAAHDRAMETVQARTHTAVLAFALAAEPVPERFHTPVSAELAALADRVTAGDSQVYGDIQTAFDGAAEVAAAARRIADVDASDDGFEQLYQEAGNDQRHQGDRTRDVGDAGDTGAASSNRRRRDGRTREVRDIEDTGDQNPQNTDVAGGHGDGGEAE
ncbi:MAG: prephenate dehydrogenase [halophilic archaeon J07HX64]|jgi:prephenate dehydrogenase (EC 1.3.1.12)|nr:MAG: prephenate dehydrogenase [halophilic archaeon J07HX64]